MDTTLLLIGTLVLGFISLGYLIQRKNTQKTDDHLVEWLKTVQKSMDQQNRQFQEVLQTSNFSINTALQNQSKVFNERLDNATRVIADVQKNIGEMAEIGRGMKEFQEFLRSPKLRGNIGEQVLKDLLSQMLPKQSFHLQYSFKNGSIVDAAIQTEAGIIPIDSKFPIDNFRKLSAAKNDQEKKDAEKSFAHDVKKHIDDISKKYIVTNEGTIDYALMYVPSEAVYYEIVNTPLLFDYSSKKRVLPVSPMTFYAYLKAILMGFEGQKISQQAQEILAGIRAIQNEYENLSESLDTLSRHVTNSYNTMTHVQTKTVKLGKQITTIHSVSKEEKELLEKTV